jgi:hypothetical protein
MAASLENVPAPVLFLEALRECEVDAGRDVMFEAVAHGLAAGESNTEVASTQSRFARRSLTVENANRLLLIAFAPGLVTAPTRAAVLSGDVAAWSLEVAVS